MRQPSAKLRQVRRCSNQLHLDVVTQPEQRYAFRLEMHQDAVRLLEDEPALGAIPLEVVQRWMAKAHPNWDPRLEQWKRLIQKRQWTDFLAQTEAGGELRRGSPVTFVVPADTRLQILQRYPILGGR